MDFIEGALAVQRALTAASSGYNALFFLRYRTPRRGRRLGALILALVNLTFLAQTLYSVLMGWSRRDASTSSLGLLVGLLPMLASLTVTAVILRGRLRQ